MTGIDRDFDDASAETDAQLKKELDALAGSKGDAVLKAYEGGVNEAEVKEMTTGMRAATDDIQRKAVWEKFAAKLGVKAVVGFKKIAGALT